MDTRVKIGRRDFLVTASVIAGGMGVSLVLRDLAVSTDRPSRNQSARKDAVELGPWIVIAPDDSVTVRVQTPESGNGVMTQAAMIVTEELQCDWAKVRAECISLNRNIRENNIYSASDDFLATFAGRSTMPERMQLLLQIGASARERLKSAAARHWNVPVAEIEAKNSVLTHKPTDRTLRFGEIAAAAAKIELEVEPQPKPQSEWTFLGKATPGKLHNRIVVTGGALYGIDVRLPGMLYAALMQSPVPGGKLKNHDYDAIRNMPGVVGVAVIEPRESRFATAEVQVSSAIAVVAEHYWQARKALEALPLEWDDGPGATWKTTEQVYEQMFAQLDVVGDKIHTNTGDAKAVLARQAAAVEATYFTPFCDQAALEPLNGTALVTDNRVEIWHSAASSRQSFVVAADEAGVPLENTYLHQTYVGGSFGRRLHGDDIRLVVAVAKKFPGHPVQAIWSREEMTRHGRYRWATAGRFRATLNKEGMPEALHARICCPGHGLLGLQDCAYANGGTIPNVRIESRDLPLHIPWGPYRAPGYNSYAFFVESFIDECAVAAKADPLEYRLRLLADWPDPGWSKCLREVATRSGWGKKLPAGQGQGIAISNWGMDGKPLAGTTVAVIAHVEVAHSGELNVLQLDLAFDCGRMLNRDAVLAQMEGGMIFGLNMSLNEELNINNGRIVEGNFDQYRMLRMGDLPGHMTVHVGGISGHDRFSEVGEPPVGPVGPAIANAIFRASGKRVRSMPFRKHDLRWA